jgi:replicative DNA helicase
VVAMAQLSRMSEARKDRKPVSSDLRDSGQIEQDADKIIMLHKPGEGSTTFSGRDGTKYIEAITTKNRNGRIGTCELFFDAEAMTFRNINNNPSYEEADRHDPF